MAKKVTPASEQDAGSNLTEDTFLHFFNELSSAIAKKDEAVAHMRTVRKNAKEAGITLKQLDATMTLRKMDDERRSAEFNDLDRYLRWLQVPTGHQFGFFELAELKDKAKADGKLAYYENRNNNENPHAPGTDLHQEWLKGWHEGQTAKAHEMKPPQEAA